MRASRPVKKKLATLLLSLAVSAGLIWLLMRGLSWERLAGSFISASRKDLALYAAATLCGLWFRAMRFRLLIPPPRPGSWILYLVTLVQNALSDLVPGRLASLGSYVYLLVRRFSISVEHAASTFIVSFVMDMVTLGPLLVLAAIVRYNTMVPAFASRLPLGWTIAFGAIFFLVSAAVVYWLGPITRAFARLAGALAGRFGRRESPRLRRLIQGLGRTAAAMEAVRGGGTLGVILVISLFIRMAKYFALFALMESLLTGAGHAGPRPDFWDLVIGISVTELVASLPIPALGQFGLWEGGMAGVLVLMGFAREPATVVAIGIHGITQAFEYLLAFGALALLVFLRRGRPDPSERAPGAPEGDSHGAVR